MSGVANMGRGITSINRLRSSLKELPLRVRSAVALEGKTTLTNDTQSAYDSGKTAYDTPRPTSVAKGKQGQPLTLKKTGRVRDAIGFVSIGTILRARLGMRYARFLIGKYAILPRTLPAKWRGELQTITQRFVADFQREIAP